MNFKVWKLGLLIAIGVGVLTTGCSLNSATTMADFIRSLCVNILASFMTYSAKHPSDQVSFSDTVKTTALMITCAFCCMAGLGFTGCSSTPAPSGSPTAQLDPAKTAAMIRNTVTPIAQVAMSQDENVRPYLGAVLAVLQSATENGAYDPIALKKSLSNISVSALRTPEAQAAIAAGLGIYEAFFGDAVTQKLSQEQWVRPVLEALRDALAAALNSPTAFWIEPNIGPSDFLTPDEVNVMKSWASGRLVNQPI